jgi:hypothetical protein
MRITAAATATSATEYIVTLDLSDNEQDIDAIIANLLQTLLALHVTPRTLSRGRSLEKHFLEVTGAANHSEG